MDPITGLVTEMEITNITYSNENYGNTDYYYRDVIQKASDIAQQNEQYIKNLAGDPPKSTDPPAVSISTRQVGNGNVEVLDPDAVILRNTGGKPTAAQKMIAGAVQSELNSIFKTELAVDGWYGNQTAGTVKDLQKALSLPKTGVLDAQTFYQLQVAYGNSAKYTHSVSKTNAGVSTKATVSNIGTGYTTLGVPGDYNSNGIPDQYEQYIQGTGSSVYQGAGQYYAGGHDPDDPRFANQWTGNSESSKNNNLLTKIDNWINGIVEKQHQIDKNNLKEAWGNYEEALKTNPNPTLKFHGYVSASDPNYEAALENELQAQKSFESMCYIGNGLKIKSNLPALDIIGKVHGKLPDVKDLGNYAKEELEILAKELKQSVKQRILKNIELGSDMGHGERQAAEQQLIKSIEKFLGGK